MGIVVGRFPLAACLAAPLLCSTSATALAQALNFTTFAYPGSTITTVTGIRGNTMTGNYSIPGSSNTGGLLFTPPFANMTPFPQATANGANFPGATSSTPYGPSFGSAAGILRVGGSYKTAASGSYDLGYLYDGAAAPGQQITTLIAPGSTLNTIAHSTFGNQVVGNYDERLATGNGFLYNIPTGSFTTINRPGAVSSTAYGVYGNQIAGGTTDAGSGGATHGYIYNQGTSAFTLYDAPGATVVTHFEGITGGGRANTYNLVADSLDVNGNTHAWAVHVDANGVATWTEIAVPGASTTSANSVYGNTVIGVYVLNGVTSAYVTTIPGAFYNPIINNSVLSSGTAGATVLAGSQGDDIINNGTVSATGQASVGINPNTYGVVTNNGTVSVTGAGSTAVVMSGSFSSLLNYGTISAAPGGIAIGTDATSAGTIVVNTGTINGQVMVNAGPYARFENSGWMGISAPGAGVTHQVSGVFAQTSSGTLSLRVGPTTSDSLSVNGAARLNGTMQTVFQGGSTFARSYTLVTATGGITGTFSSLSTVNMPAFLSASLAYGANNVTLNLQSSMSSLSGLGSNQSAVALALDGALNGSAGLNAVPGLFGLSPSQLGYALTVLSGSNASVGNATTISAGGQFTQMVANRAITRQAQPQTAEIAGTVATAQAACAATASSPASSLGSACDPGAPTTWSAWGTAFGGAEWLNADPGTAAPSAQQAVGGGAFGGDYRVGPQTVIGLGVGLSDSNYSVAATGASGRATGFHVGLYGLQNWDGFYLNAAAAYGNFSGNTTRSIAGIGTPETAKSSAVANQFAGRIEVGRPFAFAAAAPDGTPGGKIGVTPFAAFQPVVLWSPAVAESSVTATGQPGMFALNYQAQSTTSLPTFLGAQFDTDTDVYGKALNAWMRLSWVHEFSTSRAVTAGFAVLPGTGFTVDGAPAASDAVRFDIGAKYDVASQTQIFINGSTELSYRGQNIAGTAGLRIVF